MVLLSFLYLIAIAEPNQPIEDEPLLAEDEALLEDPEAGLEDEVLFDEE